MHDHPTETLRGKEPTVEGRHLHAPDGFPHSMMGMVVVFVILFPFAIGAFYVATGLGGALVAAALLLFIGVPIVTSRLKKGAEGWRRTDEAEEHEVEAAEAAGLPPPRNSIERVNDRLN